MINLRLKSIILINYGAGNMASIVMRWLLIQGEEFTSGPLPSNFDECIFILPGVGSFSEASRCIFSQQLFFPPGSKPRIIGICLGMQLLFEQSTEGGISSGLSLLQGSVYSINSHTNYKSDMLLPHVGWQPLEILPCSSSWLDSYSHRDFYFVHSFMCFPDNNQNILASVSFHGIDIPAIVKSDHIIGFQFHPEKSGPIGLHLLNSAITELSSVSL